MPGQVRGAPYRPANVTLDIGRLVEEARRRAGAEYGAALQGLYHGEKVVLTSFSNGWRICRALDPSFVGGGEAEGLLPVRAERRSVAVELKGNNRIVKLFVKGRA